MCGYGVVVAGVSKITMTPTFKTVRVSYKDMVNKRSCIRDRIDAVRRSGRVFTSVDAEEEWSKVIMENAMPSSGYVVHTLKFLTGDIQVPAKNNWVAASRKFLGFMGKLSQEVGPRRSGSIYSENGELVDFENDFEAIDIVTINHRKGSDSATMAQGTGVG